MAKHFYCLSSKYSHLETTDDGIRRNKITDRNAITTHSNLVLRLCHIVAEYSRRNPKIACIDHVRDLAFIDGCEISSSIEK